MQVEGRLHFCTTILKLLNSLFAIALAGTMAIPPLPTNRTLPGSPAPRPDSSSTFTYG